MRYSKTVKLRRPTAVAFALSGLCMVVVLATGLVPSEALERSHQPQGGVESFTGKEAAPERFGPVKAPRNENLDEIVFQPLEDLRLPVVDRIGYVIGREDPVPELLERMGFEVERLSRAQLVPPELGRYSVIVIGRFAYSLDSALVEASGPLLDFVDGGGLLLTQVQEDSYWEAGLAPFPFTQRRARLGTTVAWAPAPAHRVFSFPNRIHDLDWETLAAEQPDWLIETQDPAYEILMRSAAGFTEGAPHTLLADLGQGAYIYSSYPWARLLSEGRHGAFRLWVNLLAYRASEIESNIESRSCDDVSFQTFDESDIQGTYSGGFCDGAPRGCCGSAASACRRGSRAPSRRARGGAVPG